MPKLLVEKKLSTLVFVSVIGLIIGSYLGLLIGQIPGDANVVRDLFLFNFLPISAGYPYPVSVDIQAIKFQFGFEMNINTMSIVGVIVSLWAYRWFK
ncbi:MAG: DUF4321 domain-containing protein [Chitinivibrionia bacterium]|nr:DUF4321 domain-containing protein [Chitinivibrionia bacterium]